MVLNGKEIAMEAVLIYPDIPNAKEIISANFTEAMFNVFADEFENGGILMKKLNGLLEKEKDVLKKFKDYNNKKIKECHKSKNQEYSKGYIDALKEQNSILDKQLKILNEVNYGN